MRTLAELTYEPCRFGGDTAPEQKWNVISSTNAGKVLFGVWESGPGEMTLNFTWSESVHVLEGRAEVENLDSGERYTLVAGALMFFSRNSKWRWTIPWKLKKVFTAVAD